MAVAVAEVRVGVCFERSPTLLLCATFSTRCTCLVTPVEWEGGGFFCELAATFIPSSVSPVSWSELLC